MLCSSVEFELLLLVVCELELEELFDELLEVELCCFSYCSRSCLRFFSHSEFSLAPDFLNLQIFNVIVLSLMPRPTANSGEHPLPLAGGFKT